MTTAGEHNAAALIQDFDFRNLPASFYHDPFPTYAALRRADPVHQLPDGGVVLTRYSDLRAVYKDPKSFSSDKRQAFRPVFGDSVLFEHHTSSLVFNDPPLHTRVRKLIQGALAPKAITQLADGLTQRVDDLLERAAGRGAIDAIDDFAAAIPVEVICNLMSIPSAEREPLRHWSLAILSALEPNPTESMKRTAETAVIDFLTFLKTLIADRRRNPLDPDLDVLTKLIQGTDVANGLTEMELLHNCIFVLNAGHETTTNLIGNGIHLLLSHDAARAQLLDHPEHIGSAVEEVLRMESPNQLGNRLTTRSVKLGGKPIDKGTQITLCIGAANRDPEQFNRPDNFDIRRSPNHHLAFASGPHVCAGVNLARLEGAVALARFIRRFPRAQLAGEPERSCRARFRGFTHLPVVLD